MGIADKINREGGTIVTPIRKNEYRVAHIQPQKALYAPRSLQRPQKITAEYVGGLDGNIFVDAADVPQEARGARFASAASAIGTLKPGVNPNTHGGYLQLVKDGNMDEIKGEQPKYYFAEVGKEA